MAYFGKTFKLYGSTETNVNANSSDSQRVLTGTLTYIRDVDLYCSIASSQPGDLGLGGTAFLFDVDQTIISASATALDNVGAQWPFFRGVINAYLLARSGYDKSKFETLLSYIPQLLFVYDYPTIVITQDNIQSAIVAGNTRFATDKTSYTIYSNSTNANFMGRAFYDSSDDWFRLDFYIPFYYNDTLYLYSVGNNYGTSYGWRIGTNYAYSQSNISTSNFWTDASTDFTPTPEPDAETDPYVNGGGSTDGTGGTGGSGTFDWTSDTVPEPALPSISAVDTGFMTLFVPTLAQIQSLAAYFWQNLYADILSGQMTAAIEALKEIVANPYDAIMGCSIVPIIPSVAGSKEVKMYGVIASGITLPYLSQQWVRKDCGTLYIDHFTDSYLDYAPYTKVTSLFLPYIGTVSIDVDLIIGHTLGVVYHVDVLSGQCVAYISIDGSIEFSYMGHCAVDIPITTSDYSGAISSGLGLVGSVSNIATSAAQGFAKGGPAGAIGGALTSTLSQSSSMANDVMGMKPDIKSGGSIGGSGGLLGVQTPYLIMIAPNLSVPRGQNSFTGYPCNITITFSTITGYTQVEYIKLDNISATDSEKQEIESLMKGGVYL